MLPYPIFYCDDRSAAEAPRVLDLHRVNNQQHLRPFRNANHPILWIARDHNLTFTLAFATFS
jgi:hypothetical protein